MSIYYNDYLTSTHFQTVQQSEVVKKVVLPELYNLDDSIMNKNHRDQTLSSPEKRSWKKENGFAIICIFAIGYHTDIQTSKQCSPLICSKSTYNTILQYLQDSDHI